jgi:hypothetical protein
MPCSMCSLADRHLKAASDVSSWAWAAETEMKFTRVRSFKKLRMEKTIF